jgi:hypothetical protein
MPFPADNPFAIMNLRLLEPPVPPREANPEITPGLEEILYRALQPDPPKRYASVRELSWDLRHQDRISIEDNIGIEARIGIEDRMESAAALQKPMSRAAAILRYARMTLLPISVFAVLLYVAQHT